MAVTKKFINEGDLYKGVELQCRTALKETIDELADVLRKKIRTDVYNHAKGTFYDRTRVLLIPDMISTKIWNNFGKGIAGKIDFDEDWFRRSGNPSKYQHGNKFYGMLSLQSYLEILNEPNDWDNPYEFPKITDRKSFWDDFMDYIDGEGGVGAIYKRHLDKYVRSTYLFGQTKYVPTTAGRMLEK